MGFKLQLGGFLTGSCTDFSKPNNKTIVLAGPMYLNNMKLVYGEKEDLRTGNFSIKVNALFDTMLIDNVNSISLGYS